MQNRGYQYLCICIKISNLGEDWGLPIAAQLIYWRSMRISQFFRNRELFEAGQSTTSANSLSPWPRGNTWAPGWCTVMENSTERVRGAPYRATTRQTTPLTRAASRAGDSQPALGHELKRAEEQHKDPQPLSSLELAMCVKWISLKWRLWHLFTTKYFKYMAFFFFFFNQK